MNDRLLCSKCNLVKEVHEFSKKNGSKRGYSYKCKTCHNEYVRTVWYASNTEKQKESSSRWKKSNKFKILSKKYGVTESEIQTLFEDSRSHCQGCGEYSENLNVDHCHNTGKVRGLLCPSCNKALGLVKDNKDTLLQLHKYLSTNSTMYNKYDAE